MNHLLQELHHAENEADMCFSSTGATIAMRKEDWLEVEQGVSQLQPLPMKSKRACEAAAVVHGKTADVLCWKRLLQPWLYCCLSHAESNNYAIREESF